MCFLDLLGAYARILVTSDVLEERYVGADVRRES